MEKLTELMKMVAEKVFQDKIDSFVEKYEKTFLKVGPDKRFGIESPYCKDGYVFTCKGDYYYGHYSYNNYGHSKSRWVLQNLKTGQSVSLDTIPEIAYYISDFNFEEMILEIIRTLECKIKSTHCDLCLHRGI